MQIIAYERLIFIDTGNPSNVYSHSAHNSRRYNTHSHLKQSCEIIALCQVVCFLAMTFTRSPTAKCKLKLDHLKRTSQALKSVPIYKYTNYSIY